MTLQQIDRFVHRLEASVEVATIARILANVERRTLGLPAFTDWADLDHVDALRYKRLAESCLAQLDEDLVDQALESAAHVVCEGDEEQYSKLETQSPTVQKRMRKWARMVIQTYHDTLTGLQPGELRTPDF